MLKQQLTSSLDKFLKEEKKKKKKRRKKAKWAAVWEIIILSYEKIEA